tara:strand:+ start:40 stop:498 length:459 start_codon:yes stop_codon:yes gene_type:complete
MSALIPNTSDDDLNDLEDEYMRYLNELKALFPEHAFYNNPYEDGSSYDNKAYDDLNTNLDSKKGLLTIAKTTLEEKTIEITEDIKLLEPNKNSVTQKDVLTPEQMISDKVDIYNFHKLNIFIRAIGIAGLLFLFKLKFKGNIKNPLVSSNSN